MNETYSFTPYLRLPISGDENPLGIPPANRHEPTKNCTPSRIPIITNSQRTRCVSWKENP